MVFWELKTFYLSFAVLGRHSHTVLHRNRLSVGSMATRQLEACLGLIRRDELFRVRRLVIPLIAGFAYQS